MPILSVSHLNKKFGAFTAVDDISFSLEEGEILGLLGPNGAGKTTTIQMLLGVLTPTSGEISYFGKNLINHREDILEKVNFSSTYTNLPWTLTVRENLTYISYLYDFEDRKNQLAKVVDVFRLHDLMNLELTALSAGQLTRVNLAKAFINDPKVLLLDEPTASLDPEVAEYVREFILHQQAEKKLSIVFTSHNMTEVEEVCDRILFINSGKIVADDTPQNLTKTMDDCHIHLIIERKHVENFVEYCRKTNKKCEKEGREFSVELKEREIASFLQDLTKENITFHEISIDKPSLEDYFLAMARKDKVTVMDTII